jgi:hypothetical protein
LPHLVKAHQCGCNSDQRNHRHRCPLQYADLRNMLSSQQVVFDIHPQAPEINGTEDIGGNDSPPRQQRDESYLHKPRQRVGSGSADRPELERNA